MRMQGWGVKSVKSIYCNITYILVVNIFHCVWYLYIVEWVSMCLGVCVFQSILISQLAKYCSAQFQLLLVIGDNIIRNMNLI